MKKIQVYHLLKRTLLGPYKGSYPKNLVRSVQERSVKENQTIHKIKVVAKPYVQEYDFPDCFPLYFRRNKSFDEKSIIFFKNVIVEANTGLIVSPDSKSIFLESVGSAFRFLGWGGILNQKIKWSQKHEMEDPIFPFPDTGYYHWLLEVLPNFLICLSEVPNLKVLISPTSNVYIKDSLNFLLGKDIENRIFVLNDSKSVFLKSVVIAQYSPYSGFVNRIDINVLQKAFTVNSSATCQKVYISRSRTNKRPIANEGDIEEVLKKFGFDILFLEDLSFLDQIKHLAGAKIVVAPHGAGLSNIVFSRKLNRVIEIFQNDVYNDCFARLAVQLKADYYFLRCTNKDGLSICPVEEIEKFILES